MHFSDRIILIEQTYEPDENAIERLSGETSRSLFCDIRSVTGEEIHVAEQRGLKAVYRADVWAEEYRGEELAEVRGKRLEVYRTYTAGEKTELYLGEKVGIRGEGSGATA